MRYKVGDVVAGPSLPVRRPDANYFTGIVAAATGGEYYVCYDRTTSCQDVMRWHAWCHESQLRLVTGVREAHNIRMRLSDNVF